MLWFYTEITIVLSVLVFTSGKRNDQTIPRGVQTSLLSLYVPSKPFTCLDGSLTIPFEFINDDYCDCPDGTDEPGTSACSNGQFFCENKGFVGTLIPSHFVGDGVCDCCDGSDEYETNIICNNTCFEMAKKNQAIHEAKRTLHEAGVAKKKQLIRNSEAARAEEKLQLDQIEQTLQSLENERKDKEELKRQAEILENAGKEKHRKLWEEKRMTYMANLRNHQMLEIFSDLDTNGDSLVSIDELQQHTELDLHSDNDFTIEEARSILRSNSVNLTEFDAFVFDQISNSYRMKSEQPRWTTESTPLPEPSIDSLTTPSPPLESSTDENDLNAYARISDSDQEDSEETFEASHHDKLTSSLETSLEHEKHFHHDVMPEYDDEVKRLIEAADKARNIYFEVERKLRDVRRQVEDFKKQSNIDFGPQGEYSPIANQCFDFDEREYTYRLCLFKLAEQIQKGGSNQVPLGYWESWNGPKVNKYSKMKYTNGASCWNGPSRSVIVTLECGLEHKIMDVREPSRCEYTMTFETPLACDENIATTSLHNDHIEF